MTNTATTATAVRRRRTFQSVGLACSAALMIASVAAAQSFGGPPEGARFQGSGEAAAFGERMHGRRTARLTEALELTEEQIAAWEAQQEATRAELEPLREALENNRQALHELLESEAPDATAVGQAMLDGRTLREEGKTIHEAAKAAFEALLTSEQLERYEVIQELRPDRRRGGRRGPGRRGGRAGAGNGRFGDVPN